MEAMDRLDSIVEELGKALAASPMGEAYYYRNDVNTLRELARELRSELAADRGRAERAEAERDALSNPMRPGHSEPFRLLSGDELATLRRLADSHRHLAWWDVGSLLATVDTALARVATVEAEMFARIEQHADMLNREYRELESTDPHAAYDRLVEVREVRRLLRELKRTPTAGSGEKGGE